MTIPIKLVTGVLSIGIVSAGVSGSYELLKIKNIRHYLLKNGKTILDTTKEIQSSDTEDQNYKDWKAVIEKYKSSENEIKDFASWDEGDLSEHQKMNKLKNKCKNVIDIEKENASFQESLSKAEKYCVKQNP